MLEIYGTYFLEIFLFLKNVDFPMLNKTDVFVAIL